MEELHELIKYLKDNGYSDLKINPDLLIGIIEYFASKQEPKQCTITDVSQQRELLDAFCCTMEFDVKHETYEEDINYFLENVKADNCG